MPIQERYWHLGNLVEANSSSGALLNRAFLFGDGLFETMLIRHGKPVHFQAHLDRMVEGMRILGLEAVADAREEITWKSFVRDVVENLLRGQEKSGFGRMRITVYRQGGGRYLPEQDSPELFAEIHPLEADPWLLRPPLHLCIADSYPVVHSLLSAVKSLNALPYILAAKFAATKGLDDAIIKNARGEVAECTASNIFLVLQNRIVTPWLGAGCLPGTMRARVMAIAESLGMRVQAQPVPISRLSEATEIFVSNAIQGLQPVGSISETSYIGRQHPVMSKIRDRLDQNFQNSPNFQN